MERKWVLSMIMAISLAGVSICTYGSSNTMTFEMEDEISFDDLYVEVLSAKVNKTKNVIVGELTNKGDCTYQDIQIEAVFNDNENNEVKRVEELIDEGNEVFPGEKREFTIEVDKNEAIASVTVNVIDAQVIENEDITNGSIVITDEEWIATRPYTFSTQYEKVINVKPKGDYLLFTDKGTKLVIDGIGSVVHFVDDGEEEKYEENVLGAYRLHKVDGNLQIELGELNADKTEYKSLEESTFRLSQDVTIQDGGTYAIYYDILNSSDEVLTENNGSIVYDGKGKLTGSVYDLPLDYEADFHISVNKYLPLNDAENDFELGEYSYTKEEEYGSTWYYGRKKVSGSSGDEYGILLVQIDQKDEETRYQMVAIINGEGEISTSNYDIEGDPEDLYEFSIIGYTPVEIICNYQFVLDGGIPLQALSFEDVCEKYKNSYGATVGSDKSYLYYDTNVNDFDDHMDSNALTYVEAINDAFGLPKSVYQKMLSTTSAQGVQTQTFDNVTVSWTYHPDHGLEVLYERNE